MKQDRKYPKALVSRKAQAAIEKGHPWVYEDEIRSIEGEIAPGDLADVISDKGKYLGTGFYSPASKIRIRLISRNANDTFDAAFWKRRIKWAWEYRKQVMGKEDLSCCRIIYSESDQFPGLTVDRFGPYLVAQCLSLGMEKRKDVIYPLLAEVLREDGEEILGLYERNDVSIRGKEGLEENKGYYPLPGLETPKETTAVIEENKVKYYVDFENGQKTGFFLDQKYNRLAVARLSAGKNVLDCFTHTGAFALNAALGGAKSVCGADVSESALEMAKKNAALNGLEDKTEFIKADIFDLLPALEREKIKPYDFIILDPPAFTKSRKTTDNALRGYKEINYRAMKLLPRGGYLATCSCSHFADTAKFRAMLKSAAADAGVSLRQIEERQQAPDHPILLNVEETDYLKFFLFQVV